MAFHEGNSDQEPQAGAGNAALTQRLWRNSAYWLVYPGLLSLLPSTTQDRLSKTDTTPSVLGPPISIVNQTSALKLAWRKSDRGSYSQ